MGMFDPKYNLTKKLLENISAIERLYGQIEQLRLPRSLWLNLERGNLIQSAYVSNSIEGNSLSFAEVTNLLLGGRIPVTRDEKEVANYFVLLKQLTSFKSFDIATLLNIHRQLLAGVNDKIAGKIRNSVVVVGNHVKTLKGVKLVIKHNPPYHKQIEIRKHLQYLLNWTKEDDQTIPILKAGIFHHQYVYLHPFADGNGRTCRLLTALFLIQNGYLINKYFVLDDYYDSDRALYSNKLSTADSGDLNTWLEYFTDGIRYSLQSAISKAENSLSQIAVSMRPTPREAQILEKFVNIREFRVNDITNFLRVSRQQANNLLRGLIEKGRIEKHGTTKGVFYRIL
jgi:Fic family protein